MRNINEKLLKFISTQRYKNDSPDKNRPFNVIPSNNITMDNVEFPVHGFDNLGNEQMMYPGQDYTFPGEYVVETPMMQEGGPKRIIIKDPRNNNTQQDNSRTDHNQQYKLKDQADKYVQQKEKDYQKAVKTGDDSEFVRKYKTSPHRYKYDTDPQYKAQVDSDAKEMSKKYGSLDYRDSDIRSKNYTGTPNLAFMNPNGLTGEEAKANEEFHMGLIGAMLPIPGIQAVGELPSVIGGIKGAVNASKESGLLSNVYKGLKKTPNSNNALDLEELRRAYHNSERFLQPEESRFLHKKGHGLRENYRTSSSVWNNQQNLSDEQLNTLSDIVQNNNQLPPSPSEIQFMPDGTTRNIYNLQPTTNYVSGSYIPDYIDLRRPVNSQNSAWGTGNWNPNNPIFSKPKSINKSGLTKEEVLQKASAKDKDVVSKMSETEFENTVLKPNGEIVSYKPGPEIEQMTYGLGNRRLKLKDAIDMSDKEYADAFNERLDLLNDIIAKRNKSGVDYSVKGLDESGRLTFHTPEQSIPVKLTDKEKANVEWFNRDPKDWLINKAGLKQEGNVWKIDDGSPNGMVFNSIEEAIESVKNELKPLTEPKIISGESSWTTRLNPGQWKGSVEDIANSEYYRSIPGIEMSNTTSGVFSDNVARKGTGAYESINEYLKKLDLGRVKPGFNSQTEFSRGAWENFIKSGRGVGFYANPRTVYGTMKGLALPAVGASGYMMNQSDNNSNDNPGYFQQGGNVKPLVIIDPVEYERRKKAYDDSTAAYNMGERMVRNFNSDVNRIKAKNIPITYTKPPSSRFVPYPDTNILPYTQGRAEWKSEDQSGAREGMSILGFEIAPTDVMIDSSKYARWKKPTQPIIKGEQPKPVVNTNQGLRTGDKVMLSKDKKNVAIVNSKLVNKPTSRIDDAPVIRPNEDDKYQEWRSKLPKNLQYEGDYDLKSFWKENPNWTPENKDVHMTDKFKLPNHPTFSNESMYYKKGMKAGKWEGDNYVPLEETTDNSPKFRIQGAGTDMKLGLDTKKQYTKEEIQNAAKSKGLDKDIKFNKNMAFFQKGGDVVINKDPRDNTTKSDNLVSPNIRTLNVPNQTLSLEELEALAHQKRGMGTVDNGFVKNPNSIMNELGYLTDEQKKELENYMNNSNMINTVYQGLPNVGRIFGNGFSAADIPNNSILKKQKMGGESYELPYYEFGGDPTDYNDMVTLSKAHVLNNFYQRGGEKEVVFNNKTSGYNWINDDIQDTPVEPPKYKPISIDQMESEQDNGSIELENEREKLRRSQDIDPNSIDNNYPSPINVITSNNRLDGTTKANIILGGMGLLNNSLDKNKRFQDYQRKMRLLGSTDMKYQSNNPQNPFGNYTPNAGPGSNFQPITNTPIQNFKKGGECKVGGEYYMDEDQIKEFLENGGELEFLD